MSPIINFYNIDYNSTYKMCLNMYIYICTLEIVLNHSNKTILTWDKYRSLCITTFKPNRDLTDNRQLIGHLQVQELVDL